ncbi:hypothetical protein IFM89_025817 [Coptis chinensis]|uniref:Uncharacterized protein n=1 Tax=Coptis chinensis TaxID=261450 RepID=A0A835H950_9MAGN|nr:hypothetical protein IFM89_025817 [Coptis chinensis]
MEFKFRLLSIGLDHLQPHSPSRNVVVLDIYSFVTSLAPEVVVVKSAVLAPLFRITTLTKLDISSNYIQGELPTNGIANFIKLLHLDLRENSFNGSIPTKLFRLQRLQYLDMSSNMLNGILSQEVGALWNLRVLNLAENFLYGEIPMEIGNLTQNFAAIVNPVSNRFKRLKQEPVDWWNPFVITEFEQDIVNGYQGAEGFQP